MTNGDRRMKLKILQISNISITATRDQIFTLCQYLGRIDDIKLYPSDANMTSTTTSKVAFVKFEDERCVEVGQHLTNTVLVDMALVCVPWLYDTIPDETTFMNSGGPGAAGIRLLPPHVQNRVQKDADGRSILVTVDPNLDELGLPPYPNLPGNTDPAKAEEIRRTVYVGNLPKDVDGEDVLEFFAMFGEVMYARMAQKIDSLPCAYAYIEFSQQNSVPNALQNNGIEFQGRPLKIQHSRVAIIKPQQKTAVQAVEEIEEAIRMGRDKTGARRSRSPRRRRSPSPRKRSRSRKRSNSRRRSRSPRRRRSRSRDRKRSSSRDRRRSKSRDRRRRSRSKDRDRKDRDRKRSRSRSKDRKKDKNRKERKRSRSRSKDRNRKKDKRDRSPEKKSKKDREDSDVDMEAASLTPEKRTKKDEGSDVEMNEEALREKLLAGKKNGHSESMDTEESKTPSKIRNERKRRSSDSD